MSNNLEKIFKLFWGKVESRIKTDNFSECYVILGFPRSGTSLVGKILSDGYGIYVGESTDLVGANDHNPMGFYENKKFALLNKRFMRQSIHALDSVGVVDLRTRNFINRAKRVITTIKAIKFVKDMSRNHKWAVKATPLKKPYIFFYFWKKYIPKIKVVAVFRDPVISAHSNMKVQKNGNRYSDIINNWYSVNKEILYYVMAHNGILINYDDLLDAKKLSNILVCLDEYIGVKHNPKLVEENIINHTLNRSTLEVERLKECYPLNNDTRMLFDTMNKVKIS